MHNNKNIYIYMKENNSLCWKHLSEINLKSGGCYAHYIIMKHYIVEWNFMNIYTYTGIVYLR